MIFQTLEALYDDCLTNGTIETTETIDTTTITTLHTNATNILTTLNNLKKSLPKSANHSELLSLAMLTIFDYSKALLLFHQIIPQNEQTTLAAICIKYPALELDWEFLERMRIIATEMKENNTNLSNREWKQIELSLTLNLNSLKQELEQELNNKEIKSN